MSLLFKFNASPHRSPLVLPELLAGDALTRATEIGVSIYPGAAARASSEAIARHRLIHRLTNFDGLNHFLFYPLIQTPPNTMKIVNQVVREFRLDPTRLRWIEHYTSTCREPSCAEFSLVTFDWCNGQATNPHWNAIAPDIAQALISEDLLFV